MERRRRISIYICRLITKRSGGSISWDFFKERKKEEWHRKKDKDIILVEPDKETKEKDGAEEDEIKNEAWHYCTNNAKHRLLEIT